MGKELRFLAIETRNKMKLTQREMGERLYMSESSYSDIEIGRTSCGSLTGFLLLNMQDNPNKILNMITDKFNEAYETEISLV